MLVLLLTLAASRWWLDAGPAEIPPDETSPPGRWHRVHRLAPSESGGDEELARVLSLPYVAGRAPAPAAAGVIRYDAERATPGLNLYTSGHAPEAILMDMEGRPLHRWRCSFDRAFPGKRKDQGSYYFRRVQLLPDGDLLALFQGGGLIRLDRESKLLWSLDAPVFNDLAVTAEGELLTLVKEAKVLPEVRAGEPVLEDEVLFLSADGAPHRRISLLRALRDSPFGDLLRPLPQDADILHSNTIQRLEDPAGKGPWRPGNLLVSLRQIDVVMVVDPVTERAVWARRGPWVRQHEPVWLPGGHLLLFDNRGNHGASQVLEIDPATGEVPWRYAGASPADFASREAGAAARLPNGNTLITESERGRAFEVTPAGEVVWEFVSPHRVSAPSDSRGELVATLFEVIRVPASAVEGWKPLTDRKRPAPPR